MLIPRAAIVADTDDPAVVDALADLQHVADRLGLGNAGDMILRDTREKEAARDVMLARLRRFTLAGAAKVTRHNCPHVAGSEEAAWGPCTSPEYDYSEEVV